MVYLHLSALQLAKLIRQGEASSREIVEAHISRIEEINPAINAVVKERFEMARREADLADSHLKEVPLQELPPFHGVPGTIKECFAFEGMPNTSGVVARRNIVGIADATAVARFRKAGLIPLGVTNIPEFCMWMETNNSLYGRTNNPYNVERIAGGSSGGEGAIIGAGGSPLGLGSDLAGSLRFPAFFNGIFSHKGSSGLVPNSGQYPLPEAAGMRYLSTGPLARCAEDLYPLLRLLAGPDGIDPACGPMQLQDPATVDVTKLKVLSIEGNGRTKVSEELIEAQRNAAEHLQTRGAKVKVIKINELYYSAEIWSFTVGLHVFLAKELGIKSTGKELMRWIGGQSEHVLTTVLGALAEKYARRIAPTEEFKFQRMGEKLRQDLAKEIGSDGVLLYPSFSQVAPHHRKPLLLLNHWAYPAIMNALEMPVTQVPLGLNPNGLPLGVQVVSTQGNDHLTLAVALELEKAFGGWVMPRKKRGKTMAEWIDVAKVTDFPSGTMRCVKAKGTSILVCHVGEKYAAIENLCTHDGGTLSEGTLEEDEVVCPRHGAHFCVFDGAAMTPPAYEDVATYPTRIQDGMVQVYF